MVNLFSSPGLRAFYYTNGGNVIIYISGPITGTADFKDRFKAHEIELNKLFPLAIIKNPVEFCGHLDHDKTSWSEYMDLCIEQLGQSTHITMLDGWENSKGALVEYYLARQMGMSFI